MERVLLNNLLSGLNLEISKKRIIFLDMNFLIWLRDSATNSIEEKVFKECVKLKESGKIAFISSEHIFSEVSKNKNLLIRNKTLKLLDTLTNGVIIRTSRELMNIEVRKRISNLFDKKLPPLYVFTKIGLHLLEFNSLVIQQMKELFRVTSNEMTLLSICWNTTFEYFGKINSGESYNNAIFSKLVRDINTDSLASLSEGKNLQYYYNEELKGVAKVYEKLILENINNYKNALKNSDVYYIKDTEVAMKLASIALVEDNPKTFLVGRWFAGLFATFRSDSLSKLKNNDIDDIEHTVGALSYCHALFTDSANTSRINRIRCFIPDETVFVGKNISDLMVYLSKVQKI